MAIRLSKAEMETIISFNSLEKTANIYTTDPVWMRKLEKFGAEKRGDYAMELNIPKSWLKIQKTRKLSEDTKKKLSARMKRVNASRSDSKA